MLSRPVRNGERMAKEYVEQRDGGYFITGTRVSLDSVVYALFCAVNRRRNRGFLPSAHAENVFGALTFLYFEQGGGRSLFARRP